MNIWKISVKNIKSKPLYSCLSVFTLALSIALLLGIQQLKSSFKYQMENNLGDIELVVGAKGSPLQLVLSSVLHLDNPTGNIPYNEVVRMQKNPLIKKVVPISYGDNFQGYRIVGTTDEFLTFYNAQLNTGQLVQESMEVVLGHQVAKESGLKLGDTFKSSHGLIENDFDVHDDEFTVVGILTPTQKVIDRLIVTNLESVWDVHNHDHSDSNNPSDDEHQHEHDENHGHHHDEHDHHEHNHQHADEDKEVTSMLITFRNPAGLLTMPRNINKNTNMQAALPKFELNKLYETTGIGFQTISWIAYIIMIIAGMTIFMSLYKMIKERAFDLALWRTYGASNFQLIKMVTYEGLILVGLASLLAILLTKIGLFALSAYLKNGHLVLQTLSWNQVLSILGTVFLMVLVSIVLAIYPILRMNISTIISNEK